MVRILQCYIMYCTICRYVRKNNLTILYIIDLWRQTSWRYVMGNSCGCGNFYFRGCKRVHNYRPKVRRRSYFMIGLCTLVYTANYYIADRTFQSHYNRIVYTAARNGHSARIFSMVHMKHTTPTPAVIFNVSKLIIPYCHKTSNTESLT